MDARRVMLEQFKDWGLWYLSRPDDSVVIACLSSRRNPGIVRERIRGVTPIKPD
jgi:hypothetical protein